MVFNRTMNEIFSFTEELASRSRYKKLFYRSQDAEAVKSLDMQLTHAFHIFEVMLCLTTYALC